MKQPVEISRAYRLINSGPVLLVTSSYKDKFNIMTLAWSMPISMKPPLVAIGVAEGHYTAELIMKGEEFALNVPTKEILQAVNFCGRVSGRNRDKLKESGLTPYNATKIRPPLIAECIGHIECGLIETHKIGDHYLFVGEILAAAAEKEYFDQGWLLQNEKGRPLHHLGGNYYAVTNEKLVIEPGK